jgi:pheromone shutdown protein TraB
MKSALLLAKKEKIKVALIDQPIEITLRKFSQKLSWKEKFRFVGDIFRAIFFRKKQMELLGIEDEKEIFNLAKVPDSKLIDKLIDQLKIRYPNIYQVLVDDRNKFMVRALLNIQKKNPESKILVIVGAGHKKGMEELLAKKMLK